MKKFWMIHADGRPQPTRRHTTLESALTEARRLAGEHTERGFVVMEAILVARAGPPPVSIDLIEDAAPGEGVAGIATMTDALVADAVAAAVAADPVTIPF